MNTDQLKGSWKQLKGKARERWGKLTDDQLERIKGNREQLEGAIQKAYGKSKEEAEREVERFAKECCG